MVRDGEFGERVCLERRSVLRDKECGEEVVEREGVGRKSEGEEVHGDKMCKEK